MAYDKYIGASTEYQGTSFTRTLTKKNGDEWLANEVAIYKLLDPDGVQIGTDTSLTKSGDNLGLTFQIGKTTTTSFEGEYTLLVFLEDTVDTEFSIPIADYTITYTDLLGQ